MKYKLLGICVCITAIIISLVLPVSVDDSHSRIHQHMEYIPIAEAESSESLSPLVTHLPIVEINTNGQPILEKQTISVDGDLLNNPLTMPDDGMDDTIAEMKIINNQGQLNHEGDAPETESLISIHIRGNSSKYFDKKNYAISLVDDKGKNAPAEVIGMDSHHKWVLHGPFLDKSLIRNYMWYNISGEIMDYAPNVRFCELVINGEYMGLYVMTETITNGENGARLHLSESDRKVKVSGFVVQIDEASNNELETLNNFTSYTYRNKNNLRIVYPGLNNLDQKINKEIADQISEFEKALYSYDYDSNEYGYEEYIDVDSFVDYFIINEFTCNFDAGWLSTYLYKDISNKFRLCVWDMNSCCDNYRELCANPMRFEMYNSLWYFMLTKDEDFIDRIIYRYKELRSTYLSEEYLFNYIDDTVEYLGTAVDRNFEKWGYTFGNDMQFLSPADRDLHSYEEAIQQLKSFIHERGTWMDKNIENLRQYSAESKTKKYNEIAD